MKIENGGGDIILDCTASLLRLMRRGTLRTIPGPALRLFLLFVAVCYLLIVFDWGISFFFR